MIDEDGERARRRQASAKHLGEESLNRWSRLYARLVPLFFGPEPSLSCRYQTPRRAPMQEAPRPFVVPWMRPDYGAKQAQEKKMLR